MNATHTPGPWAIQPSSNPRNGAAWRDIISTGAEFSPCYIGEALEPDARLIAAAPETTHALADLINEIVCLSEQSDANALDLLHAFRRGHGILAKRIEAGRAAIAKAMGE